MNINEIRNNVLLYLDNLPLVETIRIASEYLDMDVDEVDGEVVLDGEPITDADWSNQYVDALGSLSERSILTLWGEMNNDTYSLNDKGEVVEWMTDAK